MSTPTMKELIAAMDVDRVMASRMSPSQFGEMAEAFSSYRARLSPATMAKVVEALEQARYGHVSRRLTAIEALDLLDGKTNQ